MTGKPRIAIVVQRYGEEVNGGAELHARWVAEHLLAIAEVHVITTCAVDFTTWEDVYEEGDSELNGVIIHRFAVDAPRDWPRAQLETARIVHSSRSEEEEIEWIREQGPYSTSLLDRIRQSANAFDAFIFFTYSYATTYFGLPLVADKAFLVPTAHDEPYLYFPAYKSVFNLPRGIIYNTQPERDLVNRVTQNRDVPHAIVGVGINALPAASGDRFREKFGIASEFVLYVGRIDEGKNVRQLVDFFIRYQHETASELKLVLIGKSHLELPANDHIVEVGFVSEQDKFNALDAAALTLMPSVYESLSMIALESWLMATPMLVNGDCEVLKYQCRQSNGGLYYHNYFEFSAALERLLRDPVLRDTLGRQGRRFTEQNYNWPLIIEKYRDLLQAQFEAFNLIPASPGTGAE